MLERGSVKNAEDWHKQDQRDKDKN